MSIYCQYTIELKRNNGLTPRYVVFTGFDGFVIKLTRSGYISKCFLSTIDRPRGLVDRP